MSLDLELSELSVEELTNVRRKTLKTGEAP